MANSIGFREANDILGRPAGSTAEECSSLELYRDGKYCISRWQLSDAELEELKKNGGKIFLMIWGSNQPPVALVAVSPFIKGGAHDNEGG